MRLSPRTRLGTYEILGPLGAGGMGEVYRARDLRLGREVAVKVLPAEVASSPDRLARFEREARTVAGLNHPNIVTLHSVEDVGGIRFLTMELVEGQSLTSLISPGGLPIARILELAIALTDALVAAHDRGVIHRDLKPGNVMLTRDGRLKVLDFGLAKMVELDTPAPDEVLTATAGSPLSGEDDVCGTVPYMSPEQLRGEAADARSDLFALGILLYELATGRRPFTGETVVDISHAILRVTPEPVTRVRSDLPVDLERIVSRCLEKNRRERAQSALDVNNDLRRLRRVLERGTLEEPASDKVASIAVLPFVNRSASAEDEYFSDGLADELLSVLAKIRGLRVSARTSSFSFKGRQATVAEIGKVLNVATVLEGSVRKAGNRVRISVQLVKVSDGYHLWSETYDRALDDIFAIQEDIARSVVKELRVALGDPDRGGEGPAGSVMSVHGTTGDRSDSPEAYGFFLHGRHYAERFTREDYAKSVEYYRKALEIDPGYAPAWAWLGRALLSQHLYGWSSRADTPEQARAAVARALELVPDLDVGHHALARIKMEIDADLDGARAALRRALQQAPGDAEILLTSARLAHLQGRTDEAIELDRRVLQLDPIRIRAHHNLGYHLFCAGQLEESEAELRKSLELGPHREIIHYLLTLVLLAQGRPLEALAESEREPDETRRLTGLAMSFDALGRRSDSDRALQTLIEKHSHGGAHKIAETFAVRNDADSAFDWLERAWAQQELDHADLRMDVCLRSLHPDPRWAELLMRTAPPRS